MNMMSFMPPAEKPADLRPASGKTDAVKKNQSAGTDDEIFSELLLMLSVSGNNRAMPQADETMTLSSGLNHSGELRKAELLKHESVPMIRQSDPHNEDREEESDTTEMAEGYLHSPGAESLLPAAGDAGAYNGYGDRERYREDFSEHMELCRDMTAEAMPEMISDFAREITNGNINEAAGAHLRTSRFDLMSQLSDRLIDLYHIGGHSAKIRLHPEELGNLHIDITVADDSIKAIVTVDEYSVKNIIEADIDMLAEKLRAAGLNIDEFTVNITSSYYEGNMAGGGADRNSRGMLHDNTFMPQTEYEDTALSGNDEKLLYAGAVNVISIFV